ncbi:metallopeptidase family protein [Asticcacaulis sp. AC402]|uniref:metallopeptidase family protein n=1 Tax=Asticcacaulis sp. AC402 TaxID=1282361 RepID=UPI0003C3B10F|nr:metallopeptidase family protein [Asticcacaulis sp. AC402]ESQ74199.1 Neutral zinc metallopeptidase [Asticcacaulis sp. AC402]
MTIKSYGEAPTLDDIEIVARTTLKKLPHPFDRHLRDVVLVVEDFPSQDLLGELGIEDPFELTGLYTGRPAELEVLTGDMPPMIHLFRRPILDEWAEGGVTLEDLIAHILIHEAGHHFGLSDDDMDWMETLLKSGTAH